MSAIETKPVIEERIYIGNVDYKATEEDLRGLFEGLKVTEVDIPTKNIYSGKKVLSKPLGFAFVQFETKEDADKVIEDYNGKEFKGRKVYVKKAVPPPTEEEKQKKLEEFRARTAAAKEKKKQEAAAAAAAAGAAGSEGAAAAADGAAAAPAPNGAAKSKKKKKAAKASPAAENAEGSTEGSSDAAAAGAPAAKKEKRVRKPKLPLEEGTKSNDTIFITNLAFDVNIKTLTSLFKDYKPIWIHVPIRKVPYKILQKQKAQGKPPKNKGIAFVKFADEAQQKKAIDEFNGKEINERTIVVDVAIDARIPEPKEDEAGEADAEAADAAPASAPAADAAEAPEAEA